MTPAGRPTCFHILPILMLQFVIWQFFLSPVLALDTLLVTSPDHVREPSHWRTFNKDGTIGHVQDIFEDADGMLWFATRKGLYRYDGLHWTAQPMPDDLIEPGTTTVYQTRDGAIWCGTYRNGIYRLNGKTWQHDPQEDMLASKEVTAFYQSRDGTLWAGFGSISGNLEQIGGIYRFNGKTWQRVPVPGHPDVARVNDIFETRDGALWISTRQRGILRFKDNAWTDYFSNDQFGTDYVSKGKIFCQTTDGALWVVRGHNGISRFNGERWETYTEKDGLAQAGFYISIWQTPDGTIWAGGHRNLARFNGKSWQTDTDADLPFLSGRLSGRLMRDGSTWIINSYNTTEFFRFDPTDGITLYTHPDSLFGGFETADGSVWFHTKRAAVQHKNNRWLAHTPSDGFFDGAVLGMHQTSNGALWFFGRSQNRARVARFYNNRWQVYTPHDGLIDNVCWYSPIVFSYFYRPPILETRDGAVWIVGGHEGRAAVCRFDGNTWIRYTHKDGLLGDWTGLGYEASDGSLWFGTCSLEKNTGAALMLFNNQTWAAFTEADGLASTHIFDMAEWPAGTLWLGTDRGLSRTDLSTKPYQWWNKTDFQIPAPKTRSFLPTQNGLWFSFLPIRRGGVVFYDGKTWHRYKKSDGLIDDAVSSIVRAADGSFFFVSIEGIGRFDGENWLRYTRQDGLKFGWILPAMRQMRDGTFWGDDSDGRVFHFRFKQGSGFPETTINAPFDRVSSAGNVFIRWSGADTWNDTLPEQLTYRWRLNKGPWSEWSARTDFTFTNLAPGTHQFEVKSRDRDGNIDPTPAAFAFYVESPWWQNPWFLTPGLLLFGLALVQTARVIRRDRRLHQANQALSEANQNLFGLNRDLQQKTDALTREIDQRERLDAQIRQLQYLNRLRTALASARTPSDLINRTGNILLETLSTVAPAGILIQFDSKEHPFGQPNSPDHIPCEHPLAWAGQTRGRLTLFCALELSPSQKSALLTETAGQLSAALEARELERQLVQSARLVSMGQMAAGVAHELNQPLSVISATAGDIYQRHLEGLALPPERLQTMMRDMLDVVQRMDATINHLRLFSRDTAQQPGVDCHLNDIVQSGLKMIRAQLEHHRIHIQLDLADNLPLTTGHPHQLEQVLINLLANARDALDQTRGTPKRLTIRTGLARTSPKSDTSPARNRLILEVEDNGVGIDAETQQHIFEPFFTTKDPDKGTGLGLSISYAIVRNHNGSITCKSTKGKGTTFCVELPAKPT